MFTVKVGAGENILSLEDDLQRHNARVSLIISPVLGSFYAFGNWEKTMIAASRLPGVTAVDYVRLLTSGPDAPPFETLFAAAAPFALGQPTPHDGVVTAAPSDSLTITYLQPDGTQLRARLTPPPPSSP